MKIELIRNEELGGDVWYHILADGNCVKASQKYEEALQKYEAIVKRAKAAKEGYPKKETIIQTEID